MVEGTRRDPGLDAARAVATLGVVLAHAALSYLTTPIGWAVRDSSSAQAVDLLVWTARQFLMPTFFLLSGWLGARTFARVGPDGLLRHRARRLVVPLAIFLVPMSMAMNGLWAWGKACTAHEAVASSVPALRGSRLPVTLGHLWYLYYLIALTVVAVLIAAAWRRAPATVRDRFARAVDTLDRTGLTALVLAVPTAGLLALGGKLQLDTPLDFAPDPLILAYFGGFFAWGWWLSRAPVTPPRWRPAASLVANAVVVALLVPALQASVTGAPPQAWALYASALSSWLLVTGIVEACRRWQAPPAPLRYVGVASFWTYLVHLPLVILLQLGAARVPAPGPLEYVAIVAVTLAASLGSFALIRPTVLGRVVA